jgi:DNA-binding CsgD family transcriptional regulator
VAERGYEVHMALGDPVAVAGPANHVVAQVQALTHAGRLAEADMLGRAGHDLALADARPLISISFALALGALAGMQGRMATSLRWYRDAAALAERTGFVGPARLALAGAAASAAQLGDVTAAAGALEREARLPRAEGPFGLHLSAGAAGRAWTVAAQGDLRQAAALLVHDADRAADAGDLVAAVSLLHDAARLGDAPEEVADRLADIAARCDSELIAARADHATGLARRDPEALGDVADRFEAMGAALYAAESATAAADARRRQGRQREAGVLAERAAVLLAACEGARTPATVTADAVVPLSAREREVAALAARGDAAKDIAERLGLSVRTVNNHLQRAYTKLGVSSRRELAAALGRGADDGPEGAGPEGEERP